MFKRNSGKNSPVETASPIDDDEQSKIAEEIKTQAQTQSVTTRSMFRYLFAAIAVIFFVCLLYTVFSPFEMEHQKHFKDLIPLYGFFGFYSGSIFCYAVCSFIVQESTQRVNSILLNAAYLVAAMSLVGWGVVFYNLNITNPLFYWLPVSNIAGIALAQYIDSDTRDMIASAAGLEQYKYNFKGV